MKNNLNNAFEEAMAFINATVPIAEKIQPKERVEQLHKCQDGSIVDICGVSTVYPKMEDRHLRNTIDYLSRRSDSSRKIIRYKEELEYRKETYRKSAKYTNMAVLLDEKG
jgi:hypothetical protein